MQRRSRTRPQSVCVTNHNAAGTRPQSVCATNLNAVDRQVSFEEQIFGVAFFYGGLAQLIVGIMELFKGNSFAFAAFGTYGAYWMAKVPARLTRPRLCRKPASGLHNMVHRPAQALTYFLGKSTESTFEGNYPDGKAAFFASFGVRPRDAAREESRDGHVPS